MDYEKSPGGIWRQCGDLQPIAIANPAAGANLSFNLGQGGIYRFICLNLTFATSATAATRTVGFTFTHGGLKFLQTNSLAGQVASNTFLYSVMGVASSAAIGGDTGIIGVPPVFFLPGNTVIATSIISLQTTDQISAIGLYVEFFPDAGEY